MCVSEREVYTCNYDVGGGVQNAAGFACRGALSRRAHNQCTSKSEHKCTIDDINATSTCGKVTKSV